MTTIQRSIDTSRLEHISIAALRYGLVLIFFCFGALKFTAYEAAVITQFGMNSPLLAWAFAALGQQGFSYTLGLIEISVGVLIATRPISAKLSAIGSVGSGVIFLVTLSLLFTTPGVIQEGYAFPALSGKVGTFLLKDVVLLAASIFTAAEALRAASGASSQKLLNRIAADLGRIGSFALRYGLALIFLWFGAIKFTAYSAKGAANFAMHSPILSWAYHLLGMQGFARALRVIETTIGLLIAMRPFAPRLSLAGSVGAVITFVITLSFLLTTPGVWQQGYGFPFLSATIGQFLIKDTVLITAAIWTAIEAMQADERRNASALAHLGARSPAMH